MKTVKIFLGVALATTAYAGLVPVSPFVNPNGSVAVQLGAANNIWGSPNAGQLATLSYGGTNLLTSLVRDTGFLIGNDAATFASDGATGNLWDRQGFGSYYNVSGVSSTGTQLLASGTYAPSAAASISYTRSYSYMPATLSGASDLLVETILVVNTGTAAITGLRAWGARNLNAVDGTAATTNTTNWNGNAASAPTVATVSGTGVTMTVSSGTPNDTNFRAGFLSTVGSASAGVANASNIMQFFGNTTRGGAGADSFNLYGGNASTAQDRPVAFGYDFGLLNAGVSAQVQIFYQFSGAQVSVSQVLSPTTSAAPGFNLWGGVTTPPAIAQNTGVPEPSTWAMLASALVAGWTIRRRRS